MKRLPKEVYVLICRGGGREPDSLLAYDDKDAAIDDAEENGERIGVYLLQNVKTPRITRELK